MRFRTIAHGDRKHDCSEAGEVENAERCLKRFCANVQGEDVNKSCVEPTASQQDRPLHVFRREPTDDA